MTKYRLSRLRSPKLSSCRKSGREYHFVVQQSLFGVLWIDSDAVFLVRYWAEAIDFIRT